MKALILCLLLILLAAAPATEPFLPYAADPSARSRSVDEIYQRTLCPAANLTSAQTVARKAVIGFYRDLGYDISLDVEHPYSQALQDKYPRHWSTQTPKPLTGDYPQPYSVDAPWNRAIPRNWPRIALPADYLRRLQLTSPNS